MISFIVCSVLPYRLEELKTIAKESSNADEFKNKVKEKFPTYSGLNYLDMTAGYFFPQK